MKRYGGDFEEHSHRNGKNRDYYQQISGRTLRE